jgi:hypothetical protein
MRTTILFALALSTFACSKVTEPLAVPVPSDPPEPRVAASLERVSVTEITSATFPMDDQQQQEQPKAQSPATAPDPNAAPPAAEAD